MRSHPVEGLSGMGLEASVDESGNAVAFGSQRHSVPHHFAESLLISLLSSRVKATKIDLAYASLPQAKSGVILQLYLFHFCISFGVSRKVSLNKSVATFLICI